MAEFTKFTTGDKIQNNDPQEYKALRRQHNIMCLVGNGFDRAILGHPVFKNYVGLPGKTSSYENFYDFINGNNRYDSKLIDESNIIYAKMNYDIEVNKKKNERRKKKQDYIAICTNFEQTITDLVFDFKKTDIQRFLKKYSKKYPIQYPLPQQTDKDKAISEEAYINKIDEDLDKLGNLFSAYLNELLPIELLVEINKQACDNKWAYTSFSEFLSDLSKEDYTKMRFTQRYINFDKDANYLKLSETKEKNNYKTKKRIECNNTYNYDLYNYMIFNFNYTTLLDNYLYLDKGQFSPQISKIKDNDRNFRFRIDEHDYIEKYFKNKNEEIKWASYLLTDIIHPHGIKDIPRSFLFGTERKIDKITDPKNRFIKSYWGQNDKQYGRCFNDTELFIIYGMSLEKCDGWWYEKIFEQLSKTDSYSELIIYKYTDINQNELPDEEYQNKISDFKISVKQEFIKGRTSYIENKDGKKVIFSDEENNVMNRIYVVPFHENLTHFLGFDKKQSSENTTEEKKE